jgi:ribulose-5-phosphate 4-epimerase/fuculose-1-phosphate aldolase
MEDQATMNGELTELRHKSVLSHRILTMTGSMADTTGHVFVRIPGTDELLVRCRNDVDVSPAYVEPRCLQRIDLEGNATEDVEGWTLPPERFIGTSIFKSRPEVGCVIHAHPPAQVLCSIVDVGIRPITGAQNWGGTMLSLGGVPTYPRSLLIHSPEIARAMLSIMGDQDVLLLKAHGNVVVGRTVEEATIRAIRLENLAKLCWQCAVSGQESPEIPLEDWEEHIRPSAAEETGMQGGVSWSWAYYVRMLEENPRLPRESMVDLEQY